MRKILYLILFFMPFLLGSCGNNKKKELNEMLLVLAKQDRQIDGHDWKQIVEFIENNKASFKDFYDDGRLDDEDVQEYITDFFHHRRPSQDIQFVGVGKDIKFHVYVEKSGSMSPYDSPRGDGSFRAAIMALQNSVPGNVQVDSIGEKGYTDFKQIFDNVLNKTKDDEVSILVTDMIYSVKEMTGVNPRKVFNEAQEMISTVFKTEVKNKSVLVVKMLGTYYGPYYAYDNSVHPFSGRRPYYIIIVASNDNMLRLSTDPTYRSFADITSLKGYDNMCLFTTSELYKPYYSFLLSNKEVKGRFKPAHGQGYQIKNLEDIQVDKNTGECQLVLAVDLSHMFIDKSYLLDKSNYQVESDDDIKIKEIRPINKQDISSVEKKYINTATHLFILTVPAVTHDEDVDIKLLNRLPKWVDYGSSDNDLTPDENTTFGLKYLLEGIYQSYQRNADGEQSYFELELKLDK